MGFDVFLQSFNASDSAGIRLDELAAIFGSALKKSADGDYDLKYGRNAICNLYVTASPADPQLIIGMNVASPIADIRLWNALYEVLSVAPMCRIIPAKSRRSSRSQYSSDANRRPSKTWGGRESFTPARTFATRSVATGRTHSVHGLSAVRL
jgi:hypothetical protein